MYLKKIKVLDFQLLLILKRFKPHGSIFKRVAAVALSLSEKIPIEVLNKKNVNL